MSPNSHLPSAPNGAPITTLPHKPSSRTKSVRWPRKYKPNPFKAAFDSMFGKPTLNLTPVDPASDDPDYQRTLHMHNPFAAPLSPILQTSPAVSNGHTVWWQDMIVGVDIASISATGIGSMSATGSSSMSATGLSSLSAAEILPLPSSSGLPSSASFAPNAEDLPWLQFLAESGVLTSALKSAEPTLPTPTTPALAASPRPAGLSAGTPSVNSPCHSMIIKSPASPTTSLDGVRTVHSTLDNAIACRKSFLPGGMSQGDSLIFLF